MLHVSERSVERAKAVERDAVPEAPLHAKPTKAKPDETPVEHFVRILLEMSELDALIIKFRLSLDKLQSEANELPLTAYEIDLAEEKMLLARKGERLSISALHRLKLARSRSEKPAKTVVRLRSEKPKGKRR
jgi:hypothetical protein